MSDRCLMTVICLKQDADNFVQLGFAHAWEREGVVCMVDYEANYAHCNDMPTGLTFIAFNDSGAEYCAGTQVCSEEGGDMTWPGPFDGKYAFEVDEEGNLSPEEKENWKQFMALRKQALEQLGLNEDTINNFYAV